MAGEWSAQQFPQQPTDGIDALLMRFEHMQREQRDQFNNLLSAAGITVTPEGMQIGSSLSIVGDLDATGTTHIGGSTDIDGTLNVDANATFGGTMTVTGDAVFSGNLAVPNGSITNDALASPLTARAASPAWANNWAGTTSWVTKASTSIAVPAGYTQAVVFATSSVTTVGSAVRYDIRTGIAGSYGAELQNLVNGVDSSSVAHTVTLAGLAGGTLALEAQVLTAPALAAHTGNIATITGFAIFFR